MDRKIVIIGLLAVGALVLLTQKKPKARNRIRALSGIRYENISEGMIEEGYTVKYNNKMAKVIEISKDQNNRKYTKIRFLNSGKEIYAKTNDILLPVERKGGFWYYGGVRKYDDPDYTKKPKQMKLFGLSTISLNKRKVCKASESKKKIHCRVQNPKEFGAFFMRTSTTPGVKYVMGMPLGTEKAVLQSVLFDKHIWGTREAKTWFNRNINRLMKRDKRTLRLDDLGKGKMHSEDYFTSSTPDMFKLKRELVLTADDEEESPVSILSKDPLEDCLKRKGWNTNAIKKTQEAISAKLTMDMFGKVERLSKDEIRLQDNTQQCLERMK